jgi:FMN-dependent NADH-azoreductase
VVQAGRTFSYGSEIRKGLLTDKKATFIIGDRRHLYTAGEPPQ